MLSAIELPKVFPRNSTPTCVPFPGGGIYESAVVLSDGRVLYVICQGGSVKQGYAAAERTFYRNNSVSGVTTIAAGLTYPTAAVFKTPEGSIFLVTSSWGDVNRCYSSPSNLGGDWVLRSTFPSDTSGPDSGVPAVGVPYMQPGGHWAIAAPKYTTSFGVGGVQSAAYVTNDYGASWSLTLSVGYYYFSAYASGNGRCLPMHDGKLWWSSHGQISGDRSAYSTDGGASWTVFYQGSVDQDLSYLESDGTWMYASEGSGTVLRSTTPTDRSSFVPYRDYALADTNSHIVLQRLDRTWMLSSQGRMLVWPGQVPPLRGRQRDDLRGTQRRSQQLSPRGGWGNAYL